MVLVVKKRSENVSEEQIAPNVQRDTVFETPRNQVLVPIKDQIAFTIQQTIVAKRGFEAWLRSVLKH